MTATNDSDTLCSAFRDAPLDIVRSILELAVTQELGVSVLCKQVRRWLSPGLFNTISLRNDHNVDDFNKTLSSRPYCSAVTSVKTLILSTCKIPDTELLARYCGRLHTIHISYQNASRLSKCSAFPETLRQLVIFGDTHFPSFDFPKVPMYEVLTHLAFVHTTPDPPPVARWLPNLTHFACAYRVHAEHSLQHLSCDLPLEEYTQPLENVLENVLAIPSIRVVVILLLDLTRMPPVSIPAIFEYVRQLEDNKVAVIARRSEAVGWAEWDVENENSFWRVAERMVERGQKWHF